MILDSLKNFDAYLPLHPRFAAVSEFLKKNDLETLAKGRHDILPNGEAFANVTEFEGKPTEGLSLEFHRKYIDIQVPLSTTETMGWLPTRELPESVLDSYSPEGDAAVAKLPSSSWATVRPGDFIIFFPQDAHAPGGAAGKVRKIIFKIML